MIIPLVKPYDFYYGTKYFSDKWSEKLHAAVIKFYESGNATLTSCVLGLCSRHGAGHFVRISLLDLLQLFQHLCLPVWFGSFFFCCQYVGEVVSSERWIILKLPDLHPPPRIMQMLTLMVHSKTLIFKHPDRWFGILKPCLR